MDSKSLSTLAGNEVIMVRNWHISTFTFLISFAILYVFFTTFQPTTLLNEPKYFLVPHGTRGAYSQGAVNSDKSYKNKLLSDDGRTIVFAWAIGLGALTGLLVHLLLIYY